MQGTTTLKILQFILR